MCPAVSKPRGILRHAPDVFRHARVAPSAVLAGVVEHFWIVQWDLGDSAPQTAEVLPHPNVHLVIERGRTQIHGIQTARFTRTLKGNGGVFGVKFRAGGFRPFLRRSVSTLRNRVLPFRDVFDADAASLEQDVFARPDHAQMIAVVERFLIPRLPPNDPTVARVAEMVDDISTDRSVTAVQQLVERRRVGTRALQRLFNDYVGVSPKWVINRYRLHEAIERLAADTPVNWADLALELGYFDQAHFIRDFRALVGRSPGDYVRQHHD